MRPRRDGALRHPEVNFLPRIMRPAEAAYYCGMGRTTFERDIRPNVPEIAIGRQGVGCRLRQA